LIRFEDEALFELSNDTVHALLHLGQVEGSGELAVYVKSRGVDAGVPGGDLAVPALLHLPPADRAHRAAVAANVAERLTRRTEAVKLPWPVVLRVVFSNSASNGRWEKGAAGERSRRGAGRLRPVLSPLGAPP
jgi:hypothetical protein